MGNPSLWFSKKKNAPYWSTRAVFYLQIKELAIKYCSFSTHQIMQEWMNAMKSGLNACKIRAISFVWDLIKSLVLQLVTARPANRLSSKIQNKMTIIIGKNLNPNVKLQFEVPPKNTRRQNYWTSIANFHKEKSKKRCHTVSKMWIFFMPSPQF